MKHLKRFLCLTLAVVLLCLPLEVFATVTEQTYSVKIFNMVHGDTSVSEKGGSISGAGNYTAGATVTLIATPNEGYCGISWASYNDVELPEASGAEYLTISFTMPAADIEITGAFRAHATGILYTDLDNGTHDSYCITCGKYEGAPAAHIDLLDYSGAAAADELCDICNANMHIHSYSAWQTDASGHRKECGCGDVVAGEHISSGAATETAPELCSVCGYEISPRLPHTHDYNSLKYDDANHWYECACGDKTQIEAHSGGAANCVDKAVCTVCKQSYGDVDSTNHPGETEIIEAIAPTETVGGFTGNTVCVSCRAVLIPGTSIDPTGDSADGPIGNGFIPALGDGAEITLEGSFADGVYEIAGSKSNDMIFDVINQIEINLFGSSSQVTLPADYMAAMAGREGSSFSVANEAGVASFDQAAMLTLKNQGGEKVTVSLDKTPNSGEMLSNIYNSMLPGVNVSVKEFGQHFSGSPEEPTEDPKGIFFEETEKTVSVGESYTPIVFGVKTGKYLKATLQITEDSGVVEIRDGALVGKKEGVTSINAVYRHSNGNTYFSDPMKIIVTQPGENSVTGKIFGAVSVNVDVDGNAVRDFGNGNVTVGLPYSDFNVLPNLETMVVYHIHDGKWELASRSQIQSGKVQASFNMLSDFIFVSETGVEEALKNPPAQEEPAPDTGADMYVWVWALAAVSAACVGAVVFRKRGM